MFPYPRFQILPFDPLFTIPLWVLLLIAVPPFWSRAAARWVMITREDPSPFFCFHTFDEPLSLFENSHTMG